MPSYTTAEIRNVALVGHAGAGKTSLVEALLLKGGAIHHVGFVEKGNTASDFNDEEKDRGHSLSAAVLHCDYQGKHLNLIDTPGYPDFIGNALSVLPAVETVLVTINAQTGIEPNARRMMESAKHCGCCRMIVINKIDAENIDLTSLLSQIKEAFGPECLPLNLPAEGGRKVIDVFRATQGESDLGSVEGAHTAMIEQVVEVDEKLMEQYLEQGSVRPDQLHEPFVKALREGHLVPICFSSARQHDKPEESIGVTELLDVIAQLAPSPLEGNSHPFVIGEGEAAKPFHVTPDSDKDSLAHVFNVVMDPFVGKLAMFRVHQGTVAKESHLRIGQSRKPFRVGHQFKLQGKEHVEIDKAIPGDIAAVAKVEEIYFDAVLHDVPGGGNIRRQPLAFPQPMYGLAITAKSRGDEQKISNALHKLDGEDPTFTITRDNITQETVIHGLGELHLRVMLEKLKHRYKVEVNTKPPKIAYRETITSKAEGHHRHKKQTGGAGQFGEVFLRIEPKGRGEGFEFSNDIFGGSIPHQYIPAIEKGVRQVLNQGAIAGYPLQDVKVSVYDGKHHPVDSKEVAFVMAGKRAFIDAVQKAKPALLEPIVTIEVTVPNQHMGDITGDLSGKRGRIQGTDMLAGDLAVIKALVPLSEVANYQNQLKSVTGGQGSYSMELSDYEAVPPNVQQQIIAQYKPKNEDD